MQSYDDIIIIDQIDEEKPVICLTCEKCFTNKAALEIHEQSEDHKLLQSMQVELITPVDDDNDDKIVGVSESCPVCLKKFLKPFNLMRHMKIHENKREHKCNLCSRAFNDKSDLRRHERTHTGQKPFCCEVCEVQFTKKSDLTRHRKTHSNVWELKCKYCSKRFYRKDALIAHRKVHLKNNEEDEEIFKFTCSCGLGFNEIVPFESHVVKMSHKKLFTCEVCQNCYINADLLKKHERYHQERMYVCGDCDKAFAHSCDLVKHRRIHTGERPYLCPACGKTFIRSTHLKSHTRNIHENLKKKKNKSKKVPSICKDENVMVQIEKCNVRIKIEGEMEVVEAGIENDNNFLIENVVRIKQEDEDDDYEIIVC